MIVNIKAEYTGNDDYFNVSDNLLTKAIEDKGYKDAYINGNEWKGEKHYLWGLIKKEKGGEITAKANQMVKLLSLQKKKTDFIIDLKEE